MVTKTSIRPFWRPAGLLALAAVLASACSASPEASPGSGTATGPRPLRVTTLGVCSEAHLAWGMEKGIFRAHDLDVQLVQTTGGSAGLAAVMSGSADLSSTNPASAILAAAQGFPIRVVSGSIKANPNGTGPYQGVAVRADSGITGAADLRGKKVAVNELGSQNHAFTLAWIRKAGVDPTDVNVVALPFPEMVAALTGGRIDAAMMTSSQVAQLTAQGAGRAIGNPLVDVVGPVPIADYITTASFASANKDTLQRFRDALDESIAQIELPANRDEVLKVTSTFCKAPVDALQRVRRDDWTTSVDAATLTAIADVLLQEKLLTKKFDVAGKLLADGPS